MRKRNLIFPLVVSSLFMPSIEALESTTEFNSLENENNIAIDILIAEGGGGGGGQKPSDKEATQKKRQAAQDAAKKRIIKSKRAAGKSLTDEEKKIICTSGDDCNFEIDIFANDVEYSNFLMKEEEVKKYLIANNIFSPSIWNIFQNYRYEILQEYINKKKHPDFISDTGYALQNETKLIGGPGVVLPKFEPYTYEKYMNNFKPLADERKFSSVLFRAFAENREELSKDIIGSEAMGFTFSEIERLLSSIMGTPFINQKL